MKSVISKVLEGAMAQAVFDVSKAEERCWLKDCLMLQILNAENSKGYRAIASQLEGWQIAQLKLRFDENRYIGCGIELIPVLTSSKAHEGINDYCPVIAEGEDRERILEKVQADTPFSLMEQMFFYRNPTGAQPIDK